jgi:hypothetical protein
MQRSSPFAALTFRVDVKRPPNPSTWFETIAAFNSGRVALAYAADCAKANGHPWEYRVMIRRGSKWARVGTAAELAAMDRDELATGDGAHSYDVVCAVWEDFGNRRTLNVWAATRDQAAAKVRARGFEVHSVNMTG